MKSKQMFLKDAKPLLMMALALSAPFVSNADEATNDGLNRCRLINEGAARLICYDQLGKQEKPVAHNKKVEHEKLVLREKLDKREKLSKEEKRLAPKVKESPALPPDDLGAESLRGRKHKKKEEIAVIAKVTECSKSGPNNKFIFYLEGGQVWKQISDKRFYFKDCDFEVTIQKDFFGYKMELLDSNKTLRVKRIR